MESKKPSKKWCIVPACESTTSKTPDKLFFYVPYQTKRRNLWVKAVRRNASEFSNLSCLYVCEDHFNLEEDMENYIKFKLMGGQKRLKTHVVPHIFACQVDRKRTAPKSPRKAAVKRSRLQLVEDILASTSSNHDVVESSGMSNDVFDLIQPSTSNTQVLSVDKCNKFVQTISPPRKYYCSKKVQCSQITKSAACSPFKISVDCATSPSKPGTSRNVSKKVSFEITTDSDSDEITSHNSHSITEDDFWSASDYSLHSDSDTMDKFKHNNTHEELKQQTLKCTLMLLCTKSRFYLGLPQDSYYIINLLQKYTPVPLVYIYVTLKKIRTGHAFAELADDFGISESNASRIFGKTVTLLSGNLGKHILWPSKQKIKENLPIAFIANYSHVQSIIDCLEIEIEKPSNSIHQSLTWSDYKKANTLKYLISSTPNGIINFISTGFGGRASDALIVEESGFLLVLPPGAAVMADRGFKHIEHLLIQRGCTLIRPPSVEKNRKSSKSEVLETKRIASLRIHIERIIRRLREFKMLKPHSCINTNLLQYADHIIIIACALANMQAALIK